MAVIISPALFLLRTFYPDSIKLFSLENKSHWKLEVSFNENQYRLRTYRLSNGHAVENFSMINKIVLNLLKNKKRVKVIVKTKQLKVGWDDVYMMKALIVGFTSV